MRKLLAYGSRSGYCIDNAVKYINEHAEAKSIGYCAKYVRKAIEVGGINTSGRPGSAKDYDSFLVKKHFYHIEINLLEEYQPLKGDIAVFKDFQGKTKFHKHGHIQMYNGKKWVSDFVQNDFWAGSDYRIYKPNFKIFRW